VGANMKPKSTRPKRKIEKPDWEAIETADWVHDLKEKEYKLSQKYQNGKKLKERYKKLNGKESLSGQKRKRKKG
jgi:hypothetical protein